MSLNLKACRICHAMSEKGCTFCGQKLPKQKDMTDREKFELHCWRGMIEYLKATHAKLKKFRMPVERTLADGSHEQVIPESLAAQVREHIGYW